MTSAVKEIVGHARRVASETANGKTSGANYAAALVAQAETLRCAATLIEASAILAMLRLSEKGAAPAKPAAGSVGP